MRTFVLILLLTTTTIGQDGIPANIGTGVLPPGMEGETDLKVINQKWIEALQNQLEALQARYDRGLDNINLLMEAQMELLIAKLDSTSVKQERLDYIQGAMGLALLTWQRIKELQKMGARGGDTFAEAQSRASVFKYREMWLKEKASDANPATATKIEKLDPRHETSVPLCIIGASTGVEPVCAVANSTPQCRIRIRPQW